RGPPESIVAPSPAVPLAPFLHGGRSVRPVVLARRRQRELRRDGNRQLRGRGKGQGEVRWNGQRRVRGQGQRDPATQQAARRNARTITGSNWPPAHRASSSRAARVATGRRYERAAVMVS